MKLEDQLVSLELAKKLKANGYIQEGLWWWFTDGCEAHSTLPLFFYLATERINPNDYKYYVAPTVAELGKRLPHRYFSWRMVNDKWGCSFMFQTDYPKTDSDTEANARAKMLLYLIKEGLVKL